MCDPRQIQRYAEEHSTPGAGWAVAISADPRDHLDAIRRLIDTGATARLRPLTAAARPGAASSTSSGREVLPALRRP